MRMPHRTKGIYSSSLRRATGGPEVAMGTGPWPQPPTEAEQLQALMATANGESWAVSFSISPTVFLSVAFVWAGVGRVLYAGSCWRASRPAH